MREFSVLLVWPGSAFIAGLFAQSNGRNPWAWFAAGMLTRPVVAPLVALTAALMPRLPRLPRRA